jgi:hypothetical protein
MAMTRDEMLGFGEGVCDLVAAIEKLVSEASPGVRQQALASALWRSLNRDGFRDGEFYLEGVRLIDGGKGIVAECLMVPPAGTRSAVVLR